MKNGTPNGFTVIELLTCLVVVGVLVGIVCRQISVYKSRAFNALAESDLQRALVAQEDYFTQNEEYVECSDVACESLLGNFKLSAGTKLVMEALSRDGGPVNGYTAVAYHPRGDKVFRFDSETHGIVEAS